MVNTSQKTIICYCYCQHSNLYYNSFNILNHNNIYEAMGASNVYKNNQVSFGQWESHLKKLSFVIVTVNTVVFTTIALISLTTTTSIKLWVLPMFIRTTKFFS